MRRAVISTVLCLVVAASAYPCSTFCFVEDGNAVFGRNYDFEFGDAYTLVNQRGVRKHSVAGDLQWTSRYGSVTFNQYGKEFPMDGMNEAGLVVALMWLDGTQYPPADARPRLGVLEWIQYQLDNHASVTDVIDDAVRLRVQSGTPLHYLIADRTGAAATIEYLGGRLVVHSGASLPAASLTNSRYDESLSYLRGFTGFGGTKPMPSGPGSLERFARASMLAKTRAGSQTGRERAFAILDSVAQSTTRWSVAYETTAGRVSWKTKTSPTVKALAIGDLDFACGAAIRRIDTNTPFSGDVSSSLGNYTAEENLAQLLHAYASTSFLQSVPRDAIESTAAHAESFSCASGSRRRAARR
ncbi:MAG: linear amide C-N hydrolase [Thermoanaerobaculia bacterium]|jgi:choloylglycine hydrolase